MIDGQRIYGTGENEAAAVRDFDTKCQRLRLGQPARDTRERFITVTQQALATRTGATSTRDLYRSLLTKWATPALGERPIGAIRRSEIVKVLQDAGQHLADSSVRSLFAALGSVFTFAVNDKLLAASPMTGIKRPTISDQAEADHFDADEVGALLRAVQDHSLRALWITLAQTGLRRGEALGLRWVDYDEAAGDLNVRGQVVRDSLGLRWKPQPKTDASKDRVAVTPRVAAELRRHRAEQAEARLLLGADWQDSGMIFASEVGGLLEPRNISRRFETLAVAAVGRKAGPHILRHSVASYLLVDKGLSLVETAAVLRHGSTAITSKSYAHLKAARSREAGLLLGGLGA